MKYLLFFLLLLPLRGSCQDCDAQLWNHVYHSDRLHVIEKCKAVTGVIFNASPEADGDVHVRLVLDDGQEELLNQGNIDKQHGCLVVEPMCKKRVTQEDAIDACNDFTQVAVKVPKKGTHVRVTGAYVFDAEHGWNEIHPVTSIEIIPED